MIKEKYDLMKLKNIVRDSILKFLVKSKIVTSILDRQESLVSLPVLDKINTRLKNIIDKCYLSTEGFTYSTNKINFTSKSQNMKVVYAIHNSLPETNNGYAIRTHYIAKSVQSVGVDIYPITRVGFPYDLKNITSYYESKEELYIDSLQYYRLDNKEYYFGEVTISSYLENYVLMLADFSQEKQATVIHGASSYINGLAAVNVGKILGIPSIYEVRGFWEITRASREKGFKLSESYKMQKRLEIQACNDATKVIALSVVVKEELIARGIEKSKICVVPNGVDTKIMKPLEKDVLLLKKLQFKDKFIIGFIGSVVDYEGLSFLIDSAEKIENLHANAFRYLIVGDGNDLANLKKQVKQKSLEHLFIFMGRVPYGEVEQYYSIIDAACYPRLDWEVCRIVSPKKPFEAMAYGIPVISSSVRANSYFIDDGSNGLIHKAEDSNDLTTQILAIYSDEALRQKLAKGGRDWVVENRDSSQTGLLLKQVYQETQEKFYN